MTLKNWMMLTAVSAALGLGSSDALAQNNGGQGGNRQRGNFDPAQMRERMMERYKETLEITSDDEWKAIQPLVEKVSTARMATMGGMGRGMFGQRRGGGDNQGAPGGGNRPPGGMFGATAEPGRRRAGKSRRSQGFQSGTESRYRQVPGSPQSQTSRTGNRAGKPSQGFDGAARSPGDIERAAVMPGPLSPSFA